MLDVPRQARAGGSFEERGELQTKGDSTCRPDVQAGACAKAALEATQRRLRDADALSQLPLGEVCANALVTQSGPETPSEVRRALATRDQGPW